MLEQLESLTLSNMTKEDGTIYTMRVGQSFSPRLVADKIGTLTNVVEMGNSREKQASCKYFHNIFLSFSITFLLCFINKYIPHKEVVLAMSMMFCFWVPMFSYIGYADVSHNCWIL